MARNVGIVAFTLLMGFGCLVTGMPQGTGSSDLATRSKGCAFGTCGAPIGGSDTGIINILREVEQDANFLNDHNVAADQDTNNNRAKRCAFGGCSVTIGGNNGGNINVLKEEESNFKNIQVMPADEESSNSRSKRCAFGGCSVKIGGDNRGNINVLREEEGSSHSRAKRCAFGKCSVGIGGSNSGNINMLTEDQDSMHNRAKRCAFGKCGIAIGGSNSGNINMLREEEAENSGNLRIVLDAEGTANIRAKRCAFGGCSINIGGDNGGNIKMLNDDHEVRHGVEDERMETAATGEAGERKHLRAKRCAYGKCDVVIGGKNSGTITGAHHVVEGAGSQVGKDIRDSLAKDLAAAGIGPSRGGSYGAQEMLGSTSVPSSTPCYFGRCSVNIPGNNTQNIKL